MTIHARSQTALTKTVVIALMLVFATGSAEAAAKRPGHQMTPAAGFTTNTGPVKDEYCGPGHVPCDEIFVAYCLKVLGGTMSDVQGWGGRTCFEPS